MSLKRAVVDHLQSKKSGRLLFPVLLILLCLSIFFSMGLVLPISAQAAVTLEVTPITWNIIGLDSNSPLTGPYRFPIGARVCNTGADPAVDVTADFVWDDGQGVFVGDANDDDYINLRAGSLASVSIGTLAAASCYDAYFEAEVTQNAASFDKMRRYHITATDSVSSATGTSPQPRELYVEHLISQNRNAVTDIKLGTTSIPPGGTMTLMVGNEYDIILEGGTATQGYEQFEAFINFPNTIFQILSVSTIYSANTSIYVSSPNDKLYADACLWENDPDSPNYLSCVGTAGKTGGSNVVTTYTVKILSGGGTSETLNSLLYDFSGSSFHYNADYGVGARFVDILGPSSVTISKAFIPKAIAPGGTSVMTFNLTNPIPETFTGVNFSDIFPAGLAVDGTPGVSYSGCGAGVLSSTTPTETPLAGGETTIYFLDGTLSPNSVCTITLTVTSASEGDYTNTTGNLFINTTTDTGNFGEDTLTVSTTPPPPSSCPGQEVELARWTMDPSQGLGTPPLYFSKAADVLTATASYTPFDITSSQTVGAGPAGSTNNVWYGDGWAPTTTGFPSAVTAAYFDFTLDTSKYGGVRISSQHYIGNGTWAAPANNFLYIYSRADAGAFSTIYNANLLKGSWQTIPATTAAATGTGTTTFRINAAGAKTRTDPMYIDTIIFTGCSAPAPAPTISKSFLTDPIVKGATSSLSFTINNTETGNQALTGVAFTDVLPVGLSIADATTSECGGTNNLITTASTRTISLTGGSLAAGGSCTFSVSVTGTTEGQYDNVSGFISSNESGTSINYATDSLTVIAPPAISKSFLPTSVYTGDTSTLSFIISNPNQLTALSVIGFTDTLPAGVTATNGTTNSLCGSGSLVITGSNLLTFTGGSLAANSSCTFSLTVTGTTIGTKNNTTSVVTSSEGGNGNTASATLVVSDPQPLIGFNKQISNDGEITWFKFVSVSLPLPKDVHYRFTVSNDGETPLNSIVVTDPDVAPCALPVSLALEESASCVVGPVSVSSVPVPDPFVNTATVTSSTTPDLTSSAKYGTQSPTIVKSAAQSYFNIAGDILDYSYVVTNSGGYPLLGPVTVTDDKAAVVTCPAVSTVGDFDNYLDPGESITCTATYTVLPADVTAKLVTNTASATVGGVTSPTDDETVNLYIPAINVVKGSTTAAITVAGQSVPYTFTVTNTGNVVLSGITVSDSNCGAGPTYQSGDTNTDSSLQVTETWIYTCSHTVTQGEIDAGGNLSNTVTADSTESGPDTDTLNIPVTQSPALSIVKTATPGTYSTVGTVIGYSYSVTNSGNTTLIGQFTVSDDKTSDESCPVTASLAPGAFITCTSSYTITQADLDSGSVTNIASATNGPVTSPTDTETVTAVQSPEINVAKSSTTVAITVAGQSVPYTFTVTNTGNITLSGITVSDPNCGAAPVLQSGDTNNDSSLQVTETWIYTCSHTVTQGEIDAGGNLSNTVTADSTESGPDTDTLNIPITQSPALTVSKSSTTVSVTAAGQVVPYTYVVTNTGNTTLTSVTLADNNTDAVPVCVPAQPATLAPAAVMNCTAQHTVTQGEIDAGGNLSNTATADSSQTAPVQNTLNIPITQSPAINVVKSSTTTEITVAGQSVPYTFTVTNAGNVTLSGITVSDPKCGVAPVLQSGDTNNDSSLQVTETWIYTCSHTVTQGEIAAGGNLSNTVTADSTESGPDTDTLDIPVTAVQSPEINVVKSSTTTEINVAGQSVPYTFTVMNTGNITLSGITVSDPNCDAGPTYQSGDTNTDSSLQVTETWIYTCSRTVTPGEIAAGGNLSNTVTADSTESGPDTDTLNIPVNLIADLSITKTDSQDPVAPGQTLTYTVLVDNAGPSDALNVVVTDTLPVGVTYLSDTDTCVESPVGTLTCSLGAIAASGFSSFDITVTVGVDTPSGMLTNFVSVSSDTADPTPDNTSTTEDTDVAQVNVIVPTMTGWGMILFTILAAIGAMYHMRRRRSC